MTRVAVVAGISPLLQDRGDPMRLRAGLEVFRALADQNGWILKVFCLSPEGFGLGQVDPIQLGVDSDVLELNYVPDDPSIVGARWKRGLKWLSGILSGTPAWVAARYSSELLEAVQEFRPDVTVAFGEAAGAYLRKLPTSTYKIWDKFNVLGVSSRTYDSSRRFRTLLTTFVSKRYERAVLQKVGVVVLTSDLERERLLDTYGSKDAVVIGSVLPNPILPQVEPVDTGQLVVGWLGSFSYRPNADGLKEFLTEIWPRFGNRGWILSIAGSGVPNSGLMAAIRASVGVRYEGFVPDISEWTRTLTCAVVPLASGAGVKLKTLTLMSSGIPVVGTGVAFEGIDIVAGQEALMVDDISELAIVMESFASYPTSRRHDLGNRGRSFVLANHTEASMRQGYHRVLAAVIGKS